MIIPFRLGPIKYLIILQSLGTDIEGITTANISLAKLSLNSLRLLMGLSLK